MSAKRSFCKITVLFSALFIAGWIVSYQQTSSSGPRPDGQYDNHAYLVDPSRMDLGRVMASFVTLHTKTKFELPDGKAAVTQKVGSGVVLDGRYILTVEHVVAQHELTETTPFGTFQFPAKKISDETFFKWKGKDVRLRPVYQNREEDIALLEIPAGIQPPSFPYQIGNTDDLRVGNFVYVIGNPLSIGINVREGIVSACRAPSAASEAGVIPDHAFMVSNGLMPGDSGSPIIAIRDGRFELVGISQGTMTANTRLSWGIRINVIRDLLHRARTVRQDKWKLAKEDLSKRPNGLREAGFFSRALGI